MRPLDPIGGIYVPTITPLGSDEKIDVGSLRRHLEFLLQGGAHGIWLLGTTGEFACLPEEERTRAVEVTLECVNGRVPVIVNIGDGSTGLALRHARNAVNAGAEMLAATPPHYYLNSPDELLSYYRAIKQALPDPSLFIYNIPQTVKVNLGLPTVLELARERTTAGIKDSQNDLVWFRELVIAIRSDHLEHTFAMFLGTRALVDVAAQLGAHGAIPAISNLAPAACVEAFTAAQRGDQLGAARAQELALRYERLSGVAAAGSASARTICGMKAVLQLWGVIESSTATHPLRSFDRGEVEELRRRIRDLPRGTHLPPDFEPAVQSRVPS